MTAPTFDIAVIGSGIAGLTAAEAAARAGCRVVNICDSELWGGLVANVGVLDGYPAGAGQAAMGMSGLDVALTLYAANAELGVAAVTQAVTGIERRDGIFHIQGCADSWQAGAVIVATGARLKMLDVPGARAFIDKGVSQCAWCDGGLYGNADVVVVGGGDAALEAALHLADLSRGVTVLVRGEHVKARPVYIERVTRHERICVRTRTEIEAVLGSDGVEGVRVRAAYGSAREDIPCRGVFVFIGLEPASAFLGDLVQRDAGGAIRTDVLFATATPGLYAAGAVRSGYRGRLTDAVAEATAAARIAMSFLGA